MHIKAIYIRSFIALLIILLIGYGFFMNTLWYLLPEFLTLESIFPVPAPLKLITFTIFIVSTALFIKNKKFIIHTLISAFACILSWYHAVVSANTGLIESHLYPFHVQKIHTSDLIIHTYSPWRISVTEPSENKSNIFTGSFPIGIDRDALLKHLISQDNCIKTVNDGVCLKARLSWP